MQVVKEVGGDIGNDALKLYLTKPNAFGDVKLEVMNVIAPGYKRRILGQEKGKLVNLLDVTIYESDNELGRYFVGGIAYNEGRGDLLEKNKRDKKAKNTDTLVLLITGIAYAFYDPANPVKTENIALGTLLPTEEYWDDELFDEFSRKLKKSYKVKFHSTSFNGAEITLNFVDSDTQPEGAAGLLASIYDINGKLKAGKENIESEVHLGIFIGSITTELAVYEHGEFNSKGFLGINLGTSDPLDRIIEDLGIDVTRHFIDHIIRKDKPLIIDGKDVTAKLIVSKEKRFDFFVKQLVSEINKKLTRQGINTTLTTHVDLGGGGGITVLDNFKKEIDIKNVDLVEDARFANALGALLSIHSKRKEEDAAADEIFNEDQQ